MGWSAAAAAGMRVCGLVAGGHCGPGHGETLLACRCARSRFGLRSGGGAPRRLCQGAGPMITFYYSPQTRAARIFWMLEEVQQPYELALVDIRSPERQEPEGFAAASPLRQGACPSRFHRRRQRGSLRFRRNLSLSRRPVRAGPPCPRSRRRRARRFPDLAVLHAVRHRTRHVRKGRRTGGRAAAECLGQLGQDGGCAGTAVRRARVGSRRTGLPRRT